MVSNTLHLDLQELLKTLERISRDFVDDPEYKKWRRQLPKDWPI